MTNQVFIRRRIVTIGVAGIVLSLGLELMHGSVGRPTSTSAVTDARTSRLVATLAPWRLVAPVSRAVVAVEPSGRIDILGGLQTGDSSTATIWQANPGRATVRRVGSLEIAVHDAGGGWFKGNAFVVAGGSFTTIGAVQEVSSGTTSETGSLPLPRSDLAVAIDRGAMYVIGGFDGTHLVSDILKTTDGVHFTSVGTLVQAVRYPAVAVVDGKIWIVGGELSTTEGTLGGPQTADIQRFDPQTGIAQIVGHLPHPLGHAMAVAIGKRLYVLSGRVGSTLSSSIWRIDVQSSVATAAGQFAYPRSDAGVAVVGDHAYLLGGEAAGPSAPLATVVILREG